MGTNVKFYDTCSLLLGLDDIFDEPFIISSITLKELEDIKTSSHKDISQKYQVRKALKLLKDNQDKYTVYIFTTDMLRPIDEQNLPITNDMRILATAISYDKMVRPDEVIFVTSDMSLYHIANLFFGDGNIEFYQPKPPVIYDGYKDITMDEDEMAHFYSTQGFNHYDLLVNEYLIVRNSQGEIVDKLCWTGANYRNVNYNEMNSLQFGKIKAYKDDVYQAFAIDSLYKNKITLLKGLPGSGKTTLALGYLFSLLEKNKIDKIVIFCNTVATKDSAKLGYYPGSKDEKLLDSQIGNILSSKLGSSLAVEKMINDGQLILLPTADIRGYDTTGMSAGVYMTEAQNMSVQLMKLALQRIGEDSICIIDGDVQTQVDLPEFEGYNNGMRRVSEVFRGEDIYGEINLKTIHRSKIANIAQRM